MNQVSQNMKDWWAEEDTPVHEDSKLTYLIDGRSALLEMCIHYIKAEKYIYLANWGMTTDFLLVRGADQRAGNDDSLEQKSLCDNLKSKGLTEQDIHFWTNNTLTLKNVLLYAIKKGVDVRVLLWGSLEIPFYSFYKPSQAKQDLISIGALCIIDDSARGIFHHQAESLHQKISIIDGTHAFVGGVDPMEQEHDYDRWDTPTHSFSNILRAKLKGTPASHPWHDAHSLIQGPAVLDVELNFKQRWNDVVKRHHKKKSLLIPDHPLTPPLHSESKIQIVRTIPRYTYHFKKHLIRGIAQVYAKAIKNAEQFIYLENQYLWVHNFVGIDIPFLGENNPEMEQNIHELASALDRGAHITIILPDDPNVGRSFTDEGIIQLRKEAGKAIEEKRLHLFCLACSQKIENKEAYKPIYVHAKVGIVDDIWSTVGSANLNNRGMQDDTEMNVAAIDAKLTKGLRFMLWTEHLGILTSDELFTLSLYLGQHKFSSDQEEQARQSFQKLEDIFNDPWKGMSLMQEQAEENFQYFKNKQPLKGHLLPYLTQEEAEKEGLPFHQDHGWIEQA